MWQAFEDELPYAKFSVRLSLSDIPNIIPILRRYTEPDLAAMRLEMAKYYKRFFWQRNLGGGAYEAVLGALHKRMVSLQSAHYRRQLRHDGSLQAQMHVDAGEGVVGEGGSGKASSGSTPGSTSDRSIGSTTRVRHRDVEGGAVERLDGCEGVGGPGAGAVSEGSVSRQLLEVWGDEDESDWVRGGEEGRGVQAWMAWEGQAPDIARFVHTDQ